MPNYLVTWTIDADEVKNPLAAAKLAWKAMRAPGSIANFFVVKNKANGEVTNVDLLKEE